MVRERQTWPDLLQDTVPLFVSSWARQPAEVPPKQHCMILWFTTKYWVVEPILKICWWVKWTLNRCHKSFNFQNFHNRCVHSSLWQDSRISLWSPYGVRRTGDTILRIKFKSYLIPWWFYSGGQTSSTMAAFSLPLLRREGGENTMQEGQGLR